MFVLDLIIMLRFPLLDFGFDVGLLVGLMFAIVFTFRLLCR